MAKQKKAPKFRKRYTFTLTKADQETITGKSETIQKDSYSIRELLENYTTGTGYPVKTLQGTFENNPTHETEVRPDAPDFDLTDADHIKQSSQITIDQAIEEQKQIKAKKLKKTEDEDFQKKLKIHESKARGSEASSGEVKNVQPSSDEVSKKANN